MGVATGRDEGIDLGRQDARLLRFLAGIDLDVAIRPAAAARHLLGQRGGQPLAVDRFDDIEQRHRLARLVGLQGADQVQFEVGIACLQGRKFLLRLLHAVLAEHALACVQELAHPVGAMGLGDGDQGDGRRIAPGGAGRGGNVLTNLGQTVGACTHASRLIRASNASALLGSAASAASRVSRALSRSPRAARQAP